MSPVIIKSPNADDIFNKWKQRNVKSQQLEKHYKVKGAVFNLENITAAEFVKGLEKAAIIFYTKSTTIQPDQGKSSKEKVSVKQLKKMKFYEFKTQPKKEDWKDSTKVPFLNTLSPISCDSCKGTGGVACHKCKGEKLVVCPDCGGKPKKCKECNGSGKSSVEIQIINDQGSKSKKNIDVKCDACFGKGSIVCSKCGGFGKVACSYCKAEGVFSCSECGGYGTLFSYEIRPVPFKTEHSSEPVIATSIKLSGLEKEIGKEIQKTIDQVEGILIAKPDKELDKKFVEPNLGYFTKDISKMLGSVEKDWKSTEKNPDLKIHMPMYLFPVIALQCETSKGKKYQIFAIGSEKKFQIFGSI